MQNFLIKQGATNPILVMTVTNTNNSLSNEVFQQGLLTATITFSMANPLTGDFRITKKTAGIIKKTKISKVAPDEYFIYYKFSEKDTAKVGHYVGEFHIKFEDSVFIGPILEPLNIFVQDSLFK